ncbi:hypothetical protein MTR_8g095180 [Medicago truncatula]|uniref:Uncharacterized protein n=1 Tax=Medicago truncatula TaxID=3880 RepID=G7LFT2_MEDTR|nr:hypothetical protein MTR_8g095180 [Medicago truncatula]
MVGQAEDDVAQNKWFVGRVHYTRLTSAIGLSPDDFWKEQEEQHGTMGEKSNRGLKYSNDGFGHNYTRMKQCDPSTLTESQANASERRLGKI